MISRTCLLVISAVVGALCASCAPVTRSSLDTTADGRGVDREIVARLFRVGYSPDRGLHLNTVYPSVLGSATEAARTYSFRCRDFAIVHRALLEHDRSYARRFARVETDVLAKANLATTRGEGRPIVLAALQRHGILDELLAASGPPYPGLTLAAAEWDPERPLISASRAASGDCPPSTRIFYYCDHGLAVSGNTADPYVAAHQTLRFIDPAYAYEFHELALDVQTRARTEGGSDSFDSQVRLTEYIRDEVGRRGIQQKIETAVASEERVLDARRSRLKEE